MKKAKIIVTILQHKRVAAPYFFINYVYPKWKALLGENIEVVLIQHKARPTKDSNIFSTTSARTSNNKISLVEEWTRSGKFDLADIIEFDTYYKKAPIIPGYYMMVREFLKRSGDLHLWLEDDVLIYDPRPDLWDGFLHGKEVGVWGKYAQLNTAHLLTRPSFAERIVDRLGDFESWDFNNIFTPNTEPFLRSQKRTSRAYLPREYCVRDHPRNYPYCGLRYLVEAVRKIAPQEAHILDIDYGEGASQLPPFPTWQRKLQRLKMNKRTPSDMFFGFYNLFLEQYLEPDYIK